MGISRLIFFIPGYNEQSAGIVCCHRLADELSRKGYDVAVLAYDKATRERVGNFGYRMFESGDAKDLSGAIMFYPEVVVDNPLKAPNVVRLILNRDGLLGGTKIERGEKDFIVSYSRVFEPGDYLFRTYYFRQNVFNLDGALPLDKRKVSIVYAGKTGIYKYPPELKPPMIFLTRDWFSWQRLAELLKEAKVIYTADCFSFINHEALLCGCAPIITDWKGWDEETLLNYELPQVYDLNKSGDFSPENVLRKREELVETLAQFDQAYSRDVDEMMSLIQDRFGSKVPVGV